MTQMSNAQARVIDPILSTVARGFKHPGFVADQLFPRVPVMSRGGKIISFGREDFKLYNTRRAAGTAARDVTFGHDGLPYALEDHSLNGLVPIEKMQEQAAVPGINAASIAVKKVDRLMTLSYEKRAADVARLAASYAGSNKLVLAGATRWDTTTGVPVADINAGREAIRQKIGMYPNFILMPPKPLTGLKEHASIRDQFKYTTMESVTLSMIAAKFDIPNAIMAPAVYVDDAGLQQDVWGNDVILAYIDVSGLEDAGSPSAFYGYELDGYPVVAAPYYDNDKRSWKYPYDRCDQPVAASYDAAYIFQTTVS